MNNNIYALYLKVREYIIIMNIFVCNICKLEFPESEKKKGYKRCINCHRQAEKERRIKNWRAIEQRRENYKERAKIIQKEYRIKNKDKINAQNKEKRHQQIIKELTEEGINIINENWILFNKENPGRHISEHLSPKQKLKIMNCYKDFKK